MAIIGTSIGNLLFKQIENGIADAGNTKDILKSNEAKTNPHKDAGKTDDKTEKNIMAGFKTILAKELKKQANDNRHKGENSLPDLNKKKDVKPFYIIPKDKSRNGESLLIGNAKKLPEKQNKKPVLEIPHPDENRALLGAGNFFSISKNNMPKKSIAIDKHATLKPVMEKNRHEGRDINKTKLVVVDLRDKNQVQKNKQQFKNNKSSKIKDELKIDESKNESKNENLLSKEDIKIFVRSRNDEANFLDLKNEFTAKNMDNKQAQVQFNQLQRNLSAELVKHTKLIIKDGGNGEIRLQLKPESLGNLRLRININDKNIDGKIFVENNIVKALVESSLPQLYDAFKKDGFNQAMINVFVGSENQNGEARGNELENAYINRNDQYWENETALEDEFLPFDSLVNIVL